MITINLSKNSCLKIQENAYSLSQDDFDQLWILRPTTSQTIKIMGKEITVPRKQQIYGSHSYSFSGKISYPKPIENPILQKILDFINGQEPQYQYQDIFVNWYQGDEYIGPHSDDEKDLDKNAPIYSLSFGGERYFRIEKKKYITLEHPYTEKYQHIIKDGMLIIMDGKMQQEFKHSIPKFKKYQQPRINLTFRVFK